MVDASPTPAPRLRIVYFGTPQFAVPSLQALLASRHPVCGVVTQPDRPRGRGQKLQPGPVKTLALAHHLPLIQPERLRDAGVIEAVAAWQPDLGVVAAYGQLLPEELLRVPPLGMINVHPSILPKYRGAAPVHRAVIAGDRVTGVTIMRMVKALDAGDMLASVAHPIGPEQTSATLERELAEVGARLLVEVVDRIAQGTVTGIPQDDAQSTYAARLTKAEGLVDWGRPAAEIHNFVRGLQPWPHAYSYLDGQRLILLTTRPVAGGTSQEPGTVIHAAADGIHVATGDGVLSILEVQPEGRRAMPVRDLLAGRPVPQGARFTGHV